jgi:hypothetical protein
MESGKITVRSAEEVAKMDNINLDSFINKGYLFTMLSEEHDSL